MLALSHLSTRLRFCAGALGTEEGLGMDEAFTLRAGMQVLQAGEEC